MAIKKSEYDKIRGLSEKEQRTLYENCLKRPEGSSIIEWMDESGLTPKPKLMSYTDPVYRKMVMIGKSSEGKSAMEDSARRGEPALSGFDKLLQSRLGNDYSETRCPGTIMSAGSIVAEIMQKLGYIRFSEGFCSEGCVARKGIIWVKD